MLLALTAVTYIAVGWGTLIFLIIAVIAQVSKNDNIHTKFRL